MPVTKPKKRTIFITQARAGRYWPQELITGDVPRDCVPFSNAVPAKFLILCINGN